MRRFFIVFILAIAAPLLVISVAVTMANRRFSLQLASGRAAQTLAPLAQGIDEEVRRAALLAATLSTDPQFVEEVVRLNASRGPRQQYEAGSRIGDRLWRFQRSTSKVGAILLYLRDQPVFLHRNSGDIFDRPLPKGEWYRDVVEKPDSTVILADLDSYGINPASRPLLKVAVCPSRESFAQGFEAMVVAFRIPLLDRVADEPGGDEELLLLDDARTVILCGSAGRLGAKVEESFLAPGVFRRGRSTYVSSPAAISSAGWTLVSITNFSKITRDAEGLSRLSRWLLLAMLLAFAAYIEVFFRQVIRPIRTVIGEMGKVQQGDWEVRVPESGPAELAQLGGSFNAMLAEVKRLTAERERQERERARLEMEALRLQINPHFLTNTLNSIKMMAGISNAEPIRRMTAALMRVVSSSFRDGDSLSPIREELATLEEYLLIMRVRYGDTFGVSVEVAEEHRGLLILRMLLQPLVENAILHGLQGIDRRGLIRIRSSVEPSPEGAGTLTVEVSDNGCGADAERLSRALAEPPDRHHGMTSIGLANIRRRILLNHGQGYGLGVDAAPGSGTTVRLRLPAISPG